MAYRGRGRGRGGFMGGRGFALYKKEPFTDFPDIELPDPKAVDSVRTFQKYSYTGLAKQDEFFRKRWRSSPFYLEEVVRKKDRKSNELERYSDLDKPKKTMKRDSLAEILGSDNFPRELGRGLKRKQPNLKKARWNRDSELDKLDLFDKLEMKFEGQEVKSEKKEGENSEEDEVEEEEEEDDEYSDDDYLKNDYFDDDEDDFNMDEGGDEEDPTF